MRNPFCPPVRGDPETGRRDHETRGRPVRAYPKAQPREFTKRICRRRSRHARAGAVHEYIRSVRNPLFPWFLIHIRIGGDVAEWSKAHPC